MVVEHYFVMCSCKRTWEGLTQLMKFKGRLHIITATIQVVVLHPTFKCNTIPILFSFMCSCSRIVNLNSINFSGGVEIHTLGQMSQHKMDLNYKSPNMKWIPKYVSITNVPT